jgi:hypothetical protein
MSERVFTEPLVPAEEFAHITGWIAKPEGLCLDDRCVPFALEDGTVDIRRFAERLGMGIAHDDATGLWALGPESGGRVLSSELAPDFELPDLSDRPFRLSSLRGQKVFLHAWASW